MTHLVERGGPGVFDGQADDRWRATSQRPALPKRLPNRRAGAGSEENQRDVGEGEHVGSNTDLTGIINAHTEQKVLDVVLHVDPLLKGGVGHD